MNFATDSVEECNKHKPTKAEKRAAREAELAEKQTALPTKRYGVIVADPEWRDLKTGECASMQVEISERRIFPPAGMGVGVFLAFELAV